MRQVIRRQGGPRGAKPGSPIAAGVDRPPFLPDGVGSAGGRGCGGAAGGWRGPWRTSRRPRRVQGPLQGKPITSKNYYRVNRY